MIRKKTADKTRVVVLVGDMIDDILMALDTSIEGPLPERVHRLKVTIGIIEETPAI